MLHHIQLPDCVPQLDRIRQFQRDVLILACAKSTVLPLTENELKKRLGKHRGKWLWKHLWKQRRQLGETEFHIALKEVIEFGQKYPDQRKRVLNAFDNDVRFHSALNDPNFRFEYLTLSAEAQTALKRLLVSFYEDLLDSGFEAAIHGDSVKLDRNRFITSFWNTNSGLEVCPVCDEKRANVVDGKHFEDADHYLPKSRYPFLSLHCMNLVPICVQCNRSFKTDRDPIDDHTNAPLPNAFHPYSRPALDYMDVLVRNSSGVRRIDFVDRDASPSRRVESLKRVSRLHERWLDSLRYHSEVLRDEISDTGRRARKYGGVITDVGEELRSELKDMLDDRKAKIGKRVGYVLQKSYLDFALNDQDEFEELLKYFAPAAST